MELPSEFRGMQRLMALKGEGGRCHLYIPSQTGTDKTTLMNDDDLPNPSHHITKYISAQIRTEFVFVILRPKAEESRS